MVPLINKYGPAVGRVSASYFKKAINFHMPVLYYVHLDYLQLLQCHDNCILKNNHLKYYI